MPHHNIYVTLKGTTSIGLFLLLSLGIVASLFLPGIAQPFSLIILAILFILAVTLHFLHQPRLSILTIYLLIFAYGFLLSDYSLFQDKLSIVASQFSIIRKALVSFQNAHITEANAPLLSALTLGDRSALEDAMVTDFRTAGVAHVLVVSGMHVGFIYLIINFFIRLLPNKHFTAFIGLCILWGYAAIVGFTPSVCRAVFMFSVMLVMRVVGEQYRSFHALFLAAFLQLLITPSALFDIGFQLSYIAVLSILIFYPLLPSIPASSSVLPVNRSKSFVLRILSFIVNSIRLTISAQILVAPLVAYYFGQFPLYFILTNLALTLLVPIIFIGGFLLFLPYLGDIIAYPLNLLLDLLRLIVSSVAALPVALVQVRLTLLALVLIYILIALVVMYAYTEQ